MDLKILVRDRRIAASEEQPRSTLSQQPPGPVGRLLGAELRDPIGSVTLLLRWCCRCGGPDADDGVRLDGAPPIMQGTIMQDWHRQEAKLLRDLSRPDVDEPNFTVASLRDQPSLFRQ
jgi:hypothetical protein